jgi:serine/threonine-protein kinase RsbW
MARRPPLVRHLVIPAVVRSLHQARLFIEQMAREAGLDDADREAVSLAVTEAVSNAIRHGSPRGVEDVVELVVANEKDRLEVTVRDSGTGFAPGEVTLPDPMSYADHGRGLFLIYALMDEVEFARDGGTIVRMVKMKKQRPPKRRPRSGD